MHIAFMEEIQDYEKNLSAQQNQESPYLRIPRQNGDQRRKKDLSQKKSQGQSQTDSGLSLSVFRQSAMKKQYRIKKSQDFKSVLDYRHLAGKNESVSVYFAPNQIGHARVGISVSKKIGNAVLRARIRRQVRAMINLLDILSVPSDIVIIVRKGFPQKNFHDNLSLLTSACSRLLPKAHEEKK